jgi:hypothetical protein
MTKQSTHSNNTRANRIKQEREKNWVENIPLRSILWVASLSHTHNDIEVKEEKYVQKIISEYNGIKDCFSYTDVN